jgi:regulator of cell morphogenesis and NO signaling
MSTQITLSAEQSLGEIAAVVPAASRVFRAAGLDYCCGGKESLGSACRERNLDPEAVLRAIQEQAPGPDPAWGQQPLPALIQHILERYHEPLRRELPELCRMAETVEEKHAAKASCPRGLARHLALIHEAVLSHLGKEEHVLFPMIVAGLGSRTAGPIRVMEMEHEEHGQNLARIREMTNDLNAPPEACPTWQALYLRLSQLEADLHDHISLENNVLFPRALCE